jgi:hypothetical protein
MQKYLLLLCLFFTLACNSNQEKRQVEAKRIRTEKMQKPREPITDLINSVWVSKVLANCHDTLKFLRTEKADFITCERGKMNEVRYRISNDTLIVDIYHDKENSSIKTSELKMVKKDGQLLFTYIAHRYGDEMTEVKPAIYTTVSEFDRVK